MASEPAVTAIQIPVLLWMRLIFQLRRRGNGRRESGAFLLGRQRGTSVRVTTFVCYDELDPRAYQSGGIAFHAEGYAVFWKHCREKRLEVVADVHTHPGEYVRQSSVDQRHPMVPVIGHTAMIVPHFAQTPWWSLRSVGVYEYLGDFKWRTHAVSGERRHVTLTAW